MRALLSSQLIIRHKHMHVRRVVDIKDGVWLCHGYVYIVGLFRVCVCVCESILFYSYFFLDYWILFGSSFCASAVE